MYEPDAREKYKRVKNVDVLVPGIILNPIVPWFGYSADGIVCKNDEVICLWEDKTPAQRKKKGYKQISKSLEYIDQNTGRLKHKTCFMACY